MKIHYTGKLEPLQPVLERKLNARFSKLGKLLGQRSEKEAHVILTAERHVRRAEITINWSDHRLAGIETAKDSYTALMNAINNLEKQILRLQTRRRDTRRGSGETIKKPAPAPEVPPLPEEDGGKVIRVNNGGAHKPMTLEEAVLLLDDKRDYVVYKDSETERISVLVRRRDGNIELIES